MGVNTASGTEATFASYAECGVASRRLLVQHEHERRQRPQPGHRHGRPTQRRTSRWRTTRTSSTSSPSGTSPSPDYVDQAIEVATTSSTSSPTACTTPTPTRRASTIDGTSYAGIKVEENGSRHRRRRPMLTNTYPTARTLFNIYNTNTVRASTGGFLNWICDSNTNFTKGLDNSTGLNFDAELSTHDQHDLRVPPADRRDPLRRPSPLPPTDSRLRTTPAPPACRSTPPSAVRTQITLGVGHLPARHRERWRPGWWRQASAISNANFPPGRRWSRVPGRSTLTLSQQRDGHRDRVSHGVRRRAGRHRGGQHRRTKQVPDHDAGHARRSGETRPGPGPSEQSRVPGFGLAKGPSREVRLFKDGRKEERKGASGSQEGRLTSPMSMHERE